MVRFLTKLLLGANLSNADLRGVKPEPGYMFDEPRLMGRGWDDAILCNTIMPDGSIRNDNCADDSLNYET